MDGGKEIQKTSKTEDLFKEIGAGLSRLERKLEKVLLSDSPEPTQVKEDTEMTVVNRELISIKYKLENLVKRIDL